MISVFVDTSAWIALLNSSDALHESAHQVMHDLRQQHAHLVTTDFVLLEVANAFAAPGSRTQAIAFINELWQMPFLTIVPVSQQSFFDGWNMYSQRSGKAWSLTDCISFTVMNHYAITLAFTSDYRFEQAGFVILLFAK